MEMYFREQSAPWERKLTDLWRAHKRRLKMETLYLCELVTEAGFVLDGRGLKLRLTTGHVLET